MFSNIYSGKKVLITGHTGFKGSWLCVWLLKLGADVVGISKDIPTQPSMFEELNIAKRVKSIETDIRDLSSICEIIRAEQPDYIFHLAAQAIVSTSYSDPVDTISTNVIGTLNILEALRTFEHKCIAVMITSDKCYDNVEWVWGYRETDHLGGKDVYSGSKGAAELVIKSYISSFFHSDHPVKLAIGRAGNVIGGGDWAKDRIVVDCMEAWSEKHSVEIRSPKATRPWQHVLEPLSGYLSIADQLSRNKELNGESFNFGPHAEYSKTVKELLDDLSKYWDLKQAPSYLSKELSEFHEAGLLKLNCDKALFHLKWMPALDYDKLIEFTSKWYYNFYHSNENMLDFTMAQIKEYENIAKEKGIIWTKY